MQTENTTRVSIDVPKELHERIKSAASFEHKTIRYFVVEAVKKRLEVIIEEQKTDLKTKSRGLNALTVQTLEKTDQGEDLYEYESVDAFFAEMAAEAGESNAS